MADQAAEQLHPGVAGSARDTHPDTRILIHRNLQIYNSPFCESRQYESGIYTGIHSVYTLVLPCMVMKPRRQSVILQLIDQRDVTSQEQLRDLLRERGIEATQATISRDVRDLGLVKRAADGAY